jgi:hypothetical protein
MSRDEIQKLLGGYATGTLTTAEQQALFEAALEDQQLFDQLAREQALRDLLHEPQAKAQVLQALQQPRRSWFTRPRVWWPAAATAAVACAALVLVFAVKRQQQPVTVATYRPPEEIRPVPSPTGAQPVAPPSAPAREETRAASKPRLPKPPGHSESPILAAPKDGDAPEKLKKEAAPAAAAPAGPPPTTLGAVSSGGRVAAPTAPASELKDVVALNSAADSIQVNERDQTVQVNHAPPQTAEALFNSNAPVATAFKAAEQSAAPSQQQEPSDQRQAVQVQALRAQVQLAQARQRMVFPGFKYRILRQGPGGTYGERSADSLSQGDKLKVQFTMNVSGRLEVKAGGETLLAQRVAAQGAYTTDQLKPGITELTVDFTPDPLPRIEMARAAQASGKAVVEHKPEETYVVGVPPTDRVHFTIQLKYR